MIEWPWYVAFLGLVAVCVWLVRPLRGRRGAGSLWLWFGRDRNSPEQTYVAEKEIQREQDRPEKDLAP